MIVKLLDSLIFLCFVVCLLLLGFNESLGQKRKTSRKSKPIVISCGICNQKAIFLPKPEYPKAAMAIRASGKVAVQILIGEKGNVIEAKAVSGHPLLRASSVKAAFQAKFEPFLLSEKPVRVNGTIVYNFSLNNSGETNKENGFIETIPLGVLNDKALKIWSLKNQEKTPRSNETIEVQLTINLQEGKAFLAKAISVYGSIGKLAEMSALQTTFKPILTEFPTIYGTGILVFKTEDFTGKIVENKNPKPILPIITTGIVNKKALSLPKPYINADIKIKQETSVKVAVVIDETGKVVFAKVLTDIHPLLRAAFENAARKAKFSYTNDVGRILIKAYIVYKLKLNGKIET